MKDLPEFPKGWHCYLLLCANGSYYCGITKDLAQRVQDHASGKGSTYTKNIKPITFVWYESHSDRRSAANREEQVKTWSKEKKRKLANGDSVFGEMGNRLQVSLV